MSILVRLTKIKSNHTNLRTDKVDGFIGARPKVGETIILVGAPLASEATARLVHTTKIQTINTVNENKDIIETRNSTYELEYLNS